jgi:hypothetical protein
MSRYEIVHSGIDPTGRAVERIAVRAILLRGERALVLRSTFACPAVE